MDLSDLTRFWGSQQGNKEILVHFPWNLRSKRLLIPHYLLLQNLKSPFKELVAKRHQLKKWWCWRWTNMVVIPGSEVAQIEIKREYHVLYRFPWHFCFWRGNLKWMNDRFGDRTPAFRRAVKSDFNPDRHLVLAWDIVLLVCLILKEFLCRSRSSLFFARAIEFNLILVSYGLPRWVEYEICCMTSRPSVSIC